jgi:hypothetical protein
MCFALTTAGLADAGEPAVAEALFEEGKRLMAAGQLSAACEKLAASYAEDASVGTMLNLARCHRKQGKTATAWTEYMEAAKLAKKLGDEKREQIARDLADALEAKLSHVSVAVTAEVDAMEVRRNGVLIQRAALGIPVAVDPGPIRIEVTAPGYASWSKDIDVSAGADLRVMVPALAPTTGTPSPSPSPQPTVVSPAPDGPEPIPDEGDSGALLYGGVAVAGLGVAGLAAGVVLGVLAGSDKDEAVARCPDNACSEEGFEMVEAARAKAHGSTAGFVVGGAALVAGVIMIVLGVDTGPETTGWVAPGCTVAGCSLLVGGAF